MDKSWLLTSISFKARIIGKLLGDGCITIQKGRKPRFQFTHSSRDFGWVNYCFEQLSDFLPLNPPKYKTTKDSRLTDGYSYSYYVQSRTSEIATYLRMQWYSERTKIVPFHILNKWLTEESLAWWYMDDGHLKQIHNKPQKIILSTDNFTKNENIELANLLKKKYHLRFSLDKQNRLILYDQFQIHYFLYLVMPYLHRSMHRKAITSYNYRFHISAKRTTISLPSSVVLAYPTKEINLTLNKLDYLIDYYKQNIFYDRYFSSFHVKRSEFNRSYQIVLTEDNLSKLYFLKEITGLNFSELTRICFLLSPSVINKNKKRLQLG